MSPDDAQNMVPVKNVIQARFDAAKSQEDRLLAEINGQMTAETNVIPYHMLPWDLWGGPFAHFPSVVCDAFPAQPWNVLFLPETDLGSAILGLPKHPRGYPLAFRDSLDKSLTKYVAMHNQLRQETDAAVAAGKVDAFGDFGDRLDIIKSRVLGLAPAYAKVTFGDDAMQRHVTLFGSALNKAFLGGSK